MKVLKDHYDAPLGSHALEEHPSGGKELGAFTSDGAAQTQQRRQPIAYPCLVFGVGNELGDGRLETFGCDRIRIDLLYACPSSDHLSERPHRKAISVRGRAALVPVDIGDEPVGELLKLPHQTALANSCLSHQRNQPSAAFACHRFEGIFEQPEFSRPADEWGLNEVRTAPTAAFG